MTLKFSVERLVEHSQDEQETTKKVQRREEEEEEDEESEEPNDDDIEEKSKDEPLAQTLSYFDVLLPHVQMACTNPFLSGMGESSGQSWSHSWLEILQNSTAAQFGDVTAGLFLQPLRKNKRIRTAFSASQLISLEKAFEGNHYVVGNERKQLASKLSLTETQVKVWFQNRRTKHKRVRLENSDSQTTISNDEDEDEDKTSTT